jgi:hypothetical protein
MYIRMRGKTINCYRATYDSKKKKCDQVLVFSLKADENLTGKLERGHTLTADERDALIQYVGSLKSGLLNEEDVRNSGNACEVVKSLIRGFTLSSPSREDIVRLFPELKSLSNLMNSRKTELDAEKPKKSEADVAEELAKALSDNSSDEMPF